MLSHQRFDPRTALETQYRERIKDILNTFASRVSNHIGPEHAQGDGKAEEHEEQEAALAAAAAGRGSSMGKTYKSQYTVRFLTRQCPDCACCCQHERERAHLFYS